MVSTPSIPQPPPPPNPPMFGSSFTKSAAQRQMNQGQNTTGFGGTILGQTNPTNTGQKTVLGG